MPNAKLEHSANKLQTQIQKEIQLAKKQEEEKEKQTDESQNK